MGAESFLVGASLLGIVAQRLVRKICDNCIEPYQAEPHELEWIQQQLGIQQVSLSQGGGTRSSRSWKSHTE